MDIEEYVNNLLRFPKDFGLNRVKETLKDLDLVDLPFKCIHIAGTKGKSSTSVMLANILKNASYKVGLFISPHLADIKERISIDGEKIGKEAFSDCYKEIKKPLSFFEALFVMALTYFRDNGVQLAILEAGIGGRLDATNIIEKPLISILTTIGLDHLEVLGDTVEKIACEKVGIIKASSPTISAPQKESVEKIIRERALSLNSPLYIVGRDYQFNYESSTNLQGERFSIHSRITGKDYKELTLNLSGHHQVINASLSVAASEILNREGYEINDDAIKIGLSSAKIRGRFEVINIGARILVLDGAHNPDSAKALFETLKEKFPGKNIIFILAALKNKLAKEIISELNNISKFFIFTELSSNETYSVEELSNILSDVNHYKESIKMKDPIEAFFYALKNSENDDVICVTGSFYLVGEIISWMEEEKNNGGEKWISQIYSHI